MKLSIRIRHKANKKRVTVFNLEKAAAVESFDEAMPLATTSEKSTKKRATVLSIYVPGIDHPFQYSDSDYLFDEIEISGAGKIYYNKLSIPELVELFGANMGA